MQSAAEVLARFPVHRETPSMAATHFVKNHGVFPRLNFAQNPRVGSRKVPAFCLTSSGGSNGGVSVSEKSSEKSEVFSVTSSSKCDVDYLGESTKGDLNVKKEHLEAFGWLP